MQLILIRHGETLWNKEKRVQGRSDIELSVAGIEQARMLALSLKNEAIAAIYTSPLKRARQTAEIINSFHGRTIETHSALMEMDMGDFEGLSFRELMGRENEFLKQWIADPASVRMPGGETLAELQDRSWESIRKILERGENALVVSHNFTIAAVLCRMRKISLAEFRSTCVDNASKTRIRISDGEAQIELMNDSSHLKPATNLS
jgi:broad specificity phosphatase PhoE